MLARALSDQRDALAFVVERPGLLVPAAVRWVERLGGGLGSPVLPFFMLSFGLSASDMGLLSTIGTLFAILPAPIYGYAQDRFGPYGTILFGAAACGLGCGLEGFSQGVAWFVAARAFQGLGGGNLPSVVNAHITSCTPVDKRALILSAFTAQCLTLRICGQALYLPWDEALRALGLTRLIRFRVTLSVCTFFCWFGVVAIITHGHHLRRAAAAYSTMDGASAEGGDEAASASLRGGREEVETSSGSVSDEAEAGRPAPAPPASTPDAGVTAHWPALLACLATLSSVACYESLHLTVWPLFLHTHYGWAEQQYAPILFASTAASAASVALAPRAHASLGGPASSEPPPESGWGRKAPPCPLAAVPRPRQTHVRGWPATGVGPPCCLHPAA